MAPPDSEGAENHPGLRGWRKHTSLCSMHNVLRECTCRLGEAFPGEASLRPGTAGRRRSQAGDAGAAQRPCLAVAVASVPTIR